MVLVMTIETLGLYSSPLRDANKYMYTSHRERGNYSRRTRNRLSCCNVMTKSSTDIGSLGMRCNTALFVYMSLVVYIV